MWFKAVRQGNIIEPVISATALLSMVCLLSRDQQYLHLTPLCLQWDPLHIIQYTFKIRENPFQGFVLGKFILLSRIMFVNVLDCFTQSQDTAVMYYISLSGIFHLPDNVWKPNWMYALILFMLANISRLTCEKYHLKLHFIRVTNIEKCI